MKRNYTIIPLSLLLLIAMVACSNKSKGNTDSEGKQPKSTVSVPQFDADSAYRYVKEQVDFGPRVPNTAAHKACGEYLAKKLEQFGATVYNQQVDLTAYDGTLLKARNIIGSYKPETKKRIVLLSHWDSRPWADADSDEEKPSHTHSRRQRRCERGRRIARNSPPTAQTATRTGHRHRTGRCRRLRPSPILYRQP